MAGGSIVIERTLRSVDELFQQAQPPHFLQMHKGAYDAAALTQFAEKHSDGIDAWLIEEMIAFDSGALTWARPDSEQFGSMSDSLIDNYFVTQNTSFDFLLDAKPGLTDAGDGAVNIPYPEAGEVYVPVAYEQLFALQRGDELRVRTDRGAQTFTIKGFVRDGQMASSLSSSTRFLVSPTDFDALRAAGGGAPEIIVEYRLTDPARVGTFQSAYEANPKLPKNGQAVTYEIIRLLNVIGEGLVAVALMFISLLLVGIALLNVRFVVQSTLEDEVRTIGALKAIGLPHETIRAMYLTKYAVMTVVACIIGGVGAGFAADSLTRRIGVHFAPAPFSAGALLVPGLALLVVFLLVVGICWALLARVKHIEVVTALVHGSTVDARRTARRAQRRARTAAASALDGVQGRRVNRRLALLDLKSKWTQWVLIPAVFTLAAVLMIVPTNLLTTLQSPQFVTYMGAPESDVRADVQFSPNIDEVRLDVGAALRADGRLANVREYANELYETQTDDNWETMPVEVGDYSGHTIQYVAGRRPGAGEIALSVLNAEKYGHTVGSQFVLRREGELLPLTVSGIYQDVTRGGYTAKMTGAPTSGAANYVFYADTQPGVDAVAVAREYNERFAAAAVVPMEQFVEQTLSFVTDAFGSAAVLAVVFSLGVVVLITSLFFNLQLARERQRLGALAALGFSAGELRAQTYTKAFIVCGAGTLLGLGAAMTVGETLVGGALSLVGFGIVKFSFIPKGPLVYGLYPLLLFLAGCVGAGVVARRIDEARTSMWIRS